jgi:hypothetical protein
LTHLRYVYRRFRVPTLRRQSCQSPSWPQLYSSKSRCDKSFFLLLWDADVTVNAESFGRYRNSAQQVIGPYKVG